ncbi:MAG TPA: 3-hydroxybutyrate dehydrogenase [Methylomirabilota bacterium]|nr:3-hydroxybutyrate dehydrogenase [Methylomirabilota bacterium]
MLDEITKSQAKPAPKAAPAPKAGLTGKVAVVTGSTSGIGLAIARGLAAEGCAVMLNGLGDASEIERTRRGLVEETGAAVDYHGADMRDPAAIAGMIDAARAAFGNVDILVNNAGIQHVAPVEAFPADKWDAILAINLSAAFHAIRAALPHMKAKAWGRIVNIASAHGLVASPFKAAYVAAKHGVLGLTKTVALETAEDGVTCNALCPGYVRTPLVDKQIDDQAKAHNIPRDQVIRDVLLARQPTKKFVEAEEVAAATVFLCMPAAASITGVALPIEGGWTAQ